MPTISFRSFLELSDALRANLIHLFESGHVFAQQNCANSFNNPLRNENFSLRFNEMLEYPRARFNFEYIDIVLSRNTELPKHIDRKNDDREGYNVCVVYSFYCTIDELQYRVAVIMCTRNDVGKALERAMKIKTNK